MPNKESSDENLHITPKTSLTTTNLQQHNWRCGSRSPTPKWPFGLSKEEHFRFSLKIRELVHQRRKAQPPTSQTPLTAVENSWTQPVSLKVVKRGSEKLNPQSTFFSLFHVFVQVYSQCYRALTLQMDAADMRHEVLTSADARMKLRKFKNTELTKPFLPSASQMEGRCDHITHWLVFGWFKANYFIFFLHGRCHLGWILSANEPHGHYTCKGQWEGQSDGWKATKLRCNCEVKDQKRRNVLKEWWRSFQSQSHHPLSLLCQILLRLLFNNLEAKGLPLIPAS